MVLEIREKHGLEVGRFEEERRLLWYLGGDNGESMMRAKNRYTKPVNNNKAWNSNWQTLKV